MKSYQSFMAGILAGALAMGAPALAQTVRQMIEVEPNSVHITVNGQAVSGENFLYNDKTYVPLREVSELLGKAVEWNHDTNTANIADVFGVLYHGEPVGTVNGESVPQEELDSYIRIVRAQSSDAASLSEEALAAQAKQQLVHDRVLIAMAKAQGIRLDEAFTADYQNFQQYINMQLAQSGMGVNALPSLIQALGYTEDDYQRTYEIAYLTQKLLDKNAALYAPMGDELSVYYNAHKEDYKYDGVRAKHILLSTVDEQGQPLASTDITRVKAKADSLYRQLQAGADFDTLMQENSEDPGLASNPNGYTFQKGEMVEPFETAAFALSEGEISQPVKSEFGYHIIRLEEKIPYLTLDDAQVVEQITETIASQKLEQLLDAEVQKATVLWN